MSWARRALTEWVWFAFTVSGSLLLWNLFFYVKYPDAGITYFWNFLWMPEDWEFRLPVMITAGLVYVIRFAVWAINRVRAKDKQEKEVS
jgi:hypothetical protein